MHDSILVLFHLIYTQSLIYTSYQTSLFYLYFSVYLKRPCVRRVAAAPTARTDEARILFLMNLCV